MNPAITQTVLEENLGKTVAVTYNGGTEHLLVVAVDADGFICKPVDAAGEEDLSLEFWLAFSYMDDLTPLSQAARSN